MISNTGFVIHNLFGKDVICVIIYCGIITIYILSYNNALNITNEYSSLKKLFVFFLFFYL